MKTPHSTQYRYTPETIAHANRLPAGTVAEHAKAGINGNKVSVDEIAKYGEPVMQGNESRPLPAGCRYLGEGEWELPEGASVDGGFGDDWTITMPDGAQIPVWTEEAGGAQ